MKKYDVTALGEILIDFTDSGLSKNGTKLFEQNPGGAVANVLSAVQKLGGKTAFIGKAGNDMHGKFLKETLENIGISTENFILDDNFFTTLAFVSLSSSGERSFSFARKPGADTMLAASEIKHDIIKNSKIFHIGSLSLTDEPARSATVAALETAKKNGVTVSYDPNYRAMLWKDKKTATDGMRSVLGYVDIIKISDEEINLLTGADTPEDAAKKLLELGVKCVIVTLGENGSFVATKNCSVFCDCKKVKVADTTGAGDSFMGGFLYKICQNNAFDGNISETELREYADFASCVAAVCVSKRGAVNAMPTLDELNNFQF